MQSVFFQFNYKTIILFIFPPDFLLVHQNKGHYKNKNKTFSEILKARLNIGRIDLESV